MSAPRLDDSRAFFRRRKRTSVLPGPGGSVFPRPRFRRWTCLLLIFVAFSRLTPAVAQESRPTGAAPKAVSEAGLPERTAASDLEVLLKTLEDPQARERLIRQIRALIERERLQAGAAPQKTAAPEAVTFFQIYERLVGGLERVVRAATANVKTIPPLLNRGIRTLQSRDTLLHLLDLLWKLAAAFALALLLSWVVRRYTVRSAGRMTAPDGAGRGWKFLLSCARAFLGLVPPGITLLTVFLALTFLQPARLGAAVVLIALWAYFLRSVLMAGVRVLIAPDRPSLRFTGLREETAAYWNIWGKRLTGYGVYGYYAVRAVETLGAMKIWVDTLSALYAAGLAVQIIVLILQQRKEVHSLLTPRREAEKDLWKTVLTGWGFLAAKWHVIGIIYLIVAYGLWVLDYPDALRLMIQASAYTLLLTVLCVVARYFLGVLLGKLLRIPERVRFRFPGIERRANRYIRLLHRVFFALLYVVTAILVLEAWGVNAFDLLFSDLGVLLIVRVLTIALILAIAAAVLVAGNFASEALLHPRTLPGGRTAEPPARLKTLVPLGRTALKVSVIVVTALVLMDQIGISITPVLAGVGVLGLAVGFGAQSLVKDVISGLFILLEDSISVGDVVILKGTGGLVENINLRTIRMRDLAGNVHVIPHSNVDMITNMTKDYSRYVLDVGVAYREDTDEVVEILKRIGAEMQADPEFGPDMLEPIEILGVDRFADSAVVIKARLMTRPIKQWKVGREFNRRMKKAFDERGIEIPFPHQTVYFGQPKEGIPPPLYMEQVARAFEKQKE